MMPAMALDAEALGMAPGKLGDDWFMHVSGSRLGMPRREGLVQIVCEGCRR